MSKKTSATTTVEASGEAPAATDPRIVYLAAFAAYRVARLALANIQVALRETANNIECFRVWRYSEHPRRRDAAITADEGAPTPTAIRNALVASIDTWHAMCEAWEAIPPTSRYGLRHPPTFDGQPD